MVSFLWIHLALIAGGLFGAVGLFLLIKDPRRRTHTFGWAIAFVLIPYLAVPVYLMIGSGRSRRTSMAKGPVTLRAMPMASREFRGVGRSVQNLLQGLGMPPACSGHAFALLATGRETFAAFLESIRDSSQSIEIATYVFKMDPTGVAIRDALIERARAGVKVRVLIDSLGSHATKKSFMKPLVDAGGEVGWFIPVFHNPRRGSGDTRNHRKIAIFDRARVIAGGSNLGEEYIGPTEIPDRWVDINFTLRGPAVQHYVDIFTSDWRFVTRQAPQPGWPEDVIDPVGDSVAHVIPSGVDVPGDILYNGVVTAIYEARERLWITTPYFVPDDPLVHALSLAARRGIDLRIIIPDVSNQHLADIGRRPSIREIDEAGGRIIRYTGGMFHAKTVVADDTWALVGSMNTDRRSLFLNFEIMLALYQPEDVNAIASWNDRLMEVATEGAPSANRRQRGWESVVRLLAPEL